MSPVKSLSGNWPSVATTGKNRRQSAGGGSEIDLSAISQMITQTKPVAVVIDSIQTMFNDTLSAAPGTISQVRESALQLMLLAKQTDIPIFPGGPCHQRRLHCRPAGIGAHGGYRALL